METHSVKNTRSPLAQNLIIFACLIIIIAGLKLSAGLVGPLLFAFTLTILIWPILQWLQKKGISKILSIVLVALTVIVSLAILFFIFYQSLEQLNDKLPYYTERLNKQFRQIEELVSKLNNGSTFIPKEEFNITTIIGTTIKFLTSFIGNIFNVGIFLFTLILMVISSDSFVRKYRNYFKKDKSNLADFILWSKNIQHQYRIQTVSNLLSAIIITIIFLILRIDFAVLWGLMTFFLAYIPNIGIALASIAPVLIAFILFGWQTALITIVFIVLLNFLMDNIVTPKFMGEQLKIPVIVVFLSLIFWIWVFGPLGAFISLPLTLAIRTFLARNPQTEFVSQLLAAEEKQEKGAKN